jgi:hypothetical protein
VADLVREIISNVLDRLNAFLDRLNAFRYRLAQNRFYRADQGIALVLLIATLLGLGVLTARAVTRPDAETLPAAQSKAARVSSSSRGKVVTETVKRQGEKVRLVRTVRLVRQRPATTVQDAVTLPAGTVRETHTVTTREVVTVTAIQPVTVTVFETVTCKPKEC